MIQQCCAAGEIHTGTPSGRVDKVHGLDCYIASPSAGTEPKGVIVILPDVFGWKLVNTRILADAYAAKGNYLVYLPELQDGMCDLFLPSSNTRNDATQRQTGNQNHDLSPPHYSNHCSR